MAVKVRGVKKTVKAKVSSLLATFPAGAESGDLALLFVTVRNATDLTPVTPVTNSVAWTPLSHSAAFNTTTHKRKCYVFLLQLNNSPASVEVATEGAVEAGELNATVVVIEKGTFSTAQPINAESVWEEQASTEPDWVAVTTTAKGCLIVGTMNQATAFTANFPPTGWTEWQAAAAENFAVITKLMPEPGFTGIPTSTKASSSPQMNFTIAVNEPGATYSDSRTGTSTSSGTVIETWSGTYTDPRTGTAATSGATVESNQVAVARTGTAVSSGSRIESWTRAGEARDAATGTAVSSGEVAASHQIVATATGTSSSAASSATSSETDESTGVLELEPEGRAETVNQHTGTGTASAASSGPKVEELQFAAPRSGTSTTAGTRADTLARADTSTATSTTSGTAKDVWFGGEFATGTAQASGTVNESWITPKFTGYSDASVGVSTTVGSSGQSYTATLTASGTATVTGTRADGWVSVSSATGTAATTPPVRSIESIQFAERPVGNASSSGTVIAQGTGGDASIGVAITAGFGTRDALTCLVAPVGVAQGEGIVRETWRPYLLPARIVIRTLPARVRVTIS
jgi:hypothetical protein